MRTDEHETMVYTTKGVVPESALPSVNEAEKSWPTPPDTRPVKLDKTCPIKGRMYDARCDISCALYTGTGCGIVEHVMGDGTVCPFPGMAHCGESCAFYRDGICAMIK